MDQRNERLDIDIELDVLDVVDESASETGRSR